MTLIDYTDNKNSPTDFVLLVMMLIDYHGNKNYQPPFQTLK